MREARSHSLRESDARCSAMNESADLFIVSLTGLVSETLAFHRGMDYNPVRDCETLLRR